MKIATILPYKENYTISKAQAAAIWVSDFYKLSRFKKNNYIFGNTKNKDFLTSNYKNIKLKTVNSKIFSTTNEYCNEFIKINKNFSFDIIEIHNRPLVFNKLKEKINSKFILYFHNDPLSMKGSITHKERKTILEKCDKIIFISKWVKKRFFHKLDEKLFNKTEIVYHSIYKQKKLQKKYKYITFVGKLNISKGYDIFRDAIIKILNKHKDWKAFSIGDETRERPIINHDSHKELGFLKHNKVLKFLEKTEIAVVPSRWEEPFGRTALEASSRGCATITSNRGGLPETTDHSIVLDKLNAVELYKKIDYLIKNKNLRKKIQLKSFKFIKHQIKDNTLILDKIREDIFSGYKINYLTNKLRIINIYNTGQKSNHRLYNISLGKKFTNGFIRNGHDVLEISDRDYIRQNRSLSFKNTNLKFQNYLIETFKNYNPDLIFFGHSKNINLETFDTLKSLNRKLIISQWNEDPMMPSLKYSSENIKNLAEYSSYVDHNFITTDPSVLSKYKNIIKNVHFFFVPVDKNIECFDISKLKPKKDLFYAMSHGVNRASLKTGKIDDRVIFLDNLIKKITNIDYDFYGYKDVQPIWGDKFYGALMNSKMGLNLSRGLPTKYYSSNRIATLMGNGLLTFVDKRTHLNDIFNNDELIFYNDIEDLSQKIKFYKLNSNLRNKISHKGKNKYFKLFNEKRVCDFIIKKITGKNFNLF